MIEKNDELEAATAPEKMSGKPIVIKLKKKNKKKKRYSRELEDIQRMERQFTRSSHRVAKAMEKGFSSYRKRRNQSAEKKQDGAIEDFVVNTGWATSRALREVSPIPYDIARTVSSKRVRRQLKRQLRRASRALRIWRW